MDTTSSLGQLPWNCHVDVIGSRLKIADEKRMVLHSFQEISDSIIDELDRIRSAIKMGIDEEDIKSIESRLKHEIGFKESSA